MRKIIDFNNDWLFAKTAEVQTALPQNWQAVTLPHTWNNVDGQDGGNDYCRCTAQYCKAFDAPQLANGERVFIEFNGAAMAAEVYLNGEKLAHHEGGYSTFRADITDALQPRNLLCVTVDNKENDRVYPQKADFTFYGGLYRGVNLIIVPQTHFELVKDGTPGIKVTPLVNLAENTAEVTAEAWLNADAEVTFEIDGQTKTAKAENGCAAATFTLNNVHLWDGVNSPYLYTATAKAGGDCIRTRFGCRVFECDAQKGFMLNGRSYPLRGVSRHQDYAGVGSALTEAQQNEDIALIKEIGANTVRLAHYQHSQYFYDLCDEAGLVVWAEIPYITAHMPNGRQNTLDQMRRLITQCYNHPCIACWGLSNEITASTPVSDDMLENHRLLNELCHNMDKTRKTTMANVFMLETNSPILEIPDINSYNLYFGWYLGELSQNDAFFDEYHKKYPNRVIGFSEYGADANPQFQAENPERGDYSEGYQCIYHEHILNMINARPYLWATHVWNMFDFAADGRDEGGAHGVNQKGLVSMDRTLKKDAFYLYKAAWNKKESFVHICGARYVNRTGEVTKVKVYSNCGEVSLYVDGALLETQKGETVFNFTVPISARHTVEAVSGECRHSIEICHVAAPDSAYTMQGAGEVTNWFDKEEINPDCYSIKDTLGALMQNAAAGKIVGALMAKASASRGDVAKSTQGNANLQKMLAQMSLQSLLKQAGDAVPPEAVKQLNSALQKIPKA